MRSYPRNSPEVAARIVALMLISDGHVCRSELEALYQLEVERELGLAPGAFAQVLHGLCEDLLAGTYGAGAMQCSVDEDALEALSGQVDRPDLRASVLRLAGGAAEAGPPPSGGEPRVQALFRSRWQGSEPASPPRA